MLGQSVLLFALPAPKSLSMLVALGCLMGNLQWRILASLHALGARDEYGENVSSTTYVSTHAIALYLSGRWDSYRARQLEHLCAFGWVQSWNYSHKVMYALTRAGEVAFEQAVSPKLNDKIVRIIDDLPF